MNVLAFTSEQTGKYITTGDVVAAVYRWGYEGVAAGFLTALAEEPTLFGKNEREQYENVRAIAVSLKNVR